MSPAEFSILAQKTLSDASADFEQSFWNYQGRFSLSLSGSRGRSKSDHPI
jgi:hypothetical protein